MVKHFVKQVLVLVDIDEHFLRVGLDKRAK